MTLKEKLSAIQVELKVPKDKFNSFGKYNFRSAESILNALKPYEAKYKVTFVSSEKYLGDKVVEVTARIMDCESDKEIDAVAIVGVEKAGGMALPQAFGSASSYGKKYAYGNLLLIDDTSDADASNNHKEKNDRFSKPIAAKQGGSAPETDLGF